MALDPWRPLGRQSGFHRGPQGAVTLLSDELQMMNFEF